MGLTVFIPAKMTSQRFPKKNMRPLHGRPLLYYSVRAAQLSEDDATVVVSSEADEVLDYAVRLGAVVHHRTPDLSNADVRNVEVMRRWYSSLSEKPELVALLQPTHPLRDPAELARAIAEMRQNPDADSLFAVIPALELTGTVRDGAFRPDVPLPRNLAAEPPRFRNTGSFYLFRPERTFMTDAPFGRKIRAYELRRPELEVDIDYEHDLDYAEAIFSKQPDLLEKYA